MPLVGLRTAGQMATTCLRDVCVSGSGVQRTRPTTHTDSRLPGESLSNTQELRRKRNTSKFQKPEGVPHTHFGSRLWLVRTISCACSLHTGYRVSGIDISLPMATFSIDIMLPSCFFVRFHRYLISEAIRYVHASCMYIHGYPGLIHIHPQMSHWYPYIRTASGQLSWAVGRHLWGRSTIDLGWALEPGEMALALFSNSLVGFCSAFGFNLSGNMGLKQRGTVKVCRGGLGQNGVLGDEKFR